MADLALNLPSFASYLRIQKTNQLDSGLFLLHSYEFVVLAQLLEYNVGPLPTSLSVPFGILVWQRRFLLSYSQNLGLCLLVTLEVVFPSYLSVWRLLLVLGHCLSHVLWEIFVAAGVVAVAHFATYWRIMPSSPDFVTLLVNPDCSDLVALVPVKVALLVEVAGFAMPVVVAKPVVVVERPVAAAMPAVVAVLVVAVARPVAAVQAMELFELHSD